MQIGWLGTMHTAGQLQLRVDIKFAAISSARIHETGDFDAGISAEHASTPAPRHPVRTAHSPGSGCGDCNGNYNKSNDTILLMCHNEIGTILEMSL